MASHPPRVRVKERETISKIPESIQAVQQLIDRHGVAITLQFIAATCRDRSVQWEQKAEIVDSAAQQIKELEPETRSEA